MKYIILTILILQCYNIVGQTVFMQANKQVWPSHFPLSYAKKIRLVKELSNNTIAIITEDKKGYSHVHIMAEENKFENNISESLNPIYDSREDAIKTKGTINDMVEVQGNLYLVGYTYQGKEKQNQGWLVKTTIDGAFLWEKTFGLSRDDDFMGIRAVEDSLFIVGNCRYYEWQNTDIWWMKTNLKGERIIEDQIHLSADEYVEKVLFTPDGTCYVGGNLIADEEEKGFLAALDQKGQIIKNVRGDSCHTFKHKAFIRDMALTYDNGIALCGYIFSSQINKDGWVAKYSITEDKVSWEKTYGEKEGDDVFEDVQETPNGTLVAMGHTTSYQLGTNSPHIWEQLINHINGTNEQPPHVNEEWKNSHQVKTITFTKNGNIFIGGILGRKPFVAKYRGFADIQNPRINWTNIKNTRVEEVIKKDEKNYFKNVIEISSPVLISSKYFYLIHNEDTVSIASKCRRFELSAPRYSRIDSTNQIQYQYNLEVEMLIEETMNVELGLNSPLYQATTAPLEIQLVNIPFFSMAWVNPQYNTSKNITDESILHVKLVIQSSDTLQDEDFRLFLNDNMLRTKKYENIIVNKGLYSGAFQHIHNYTYYNAIPLKKGINKIQLKVQKGGEMYESDAILYEYKDNILFVNTTVDTFVNKNKATLRVLGIGVEHFDLKYTVKDATDFVNSYQRIQSKHKNHYSDIEIDQLLGTEADKIAVEGKFENLKNAYQIGDISKDDVLVIFIASHGLIYKDSFPGYKYEDGKKTVESVKTKEYRIATHGYDVAVEKSNSIAFDEILKYLFPIQCKKIILLDACFSGGANLNQNRETIPWLSLRDPNLVIITSSDSLEVSYELATKQNGAFTEAILSSNSSPSMNDGVLTLAEFYKHIKRTVPFLIEAELGNLYHQNPQITQFSLSMIPIFWR